VSQVADSSETLAMRAGDLKRLTDEFVVGGTQRGGPSPTPGDGGGSRPTPADD
jgi:hypothetical protein